MAGEVTCSFGEEETGSSCSGLVCSSSHHVKVLPVSPTGHMCRHISQVVLTDITAGTVALHKN